MKIYAGRIVPPQDPQSQRVMKLASRLLDANKDLIPETHPKNWTFTLVIDPTISAFCLSVSKIFLFLHFYLYLNLVDKKKKK